MTKKMCVLLLCCLACFAACNKSEKAKEENMTITENPLLGDYQTPFKVPPFKKVKPEHYMPAFIKGMAEQRAEIEKIFTAPETADFVNTVAALANSGMLLDRVSNMFFSEISANSNAELQKVEAEISPLLSAFHDEIYLNEALFARVREVFDKKSTLTLNEEQHYLLDNIYKKFVRSGTGLSAADKEKLKKINQELSALVVRFSQNLLAENRNFKLVIDNPRDLTGLPDSVVAAAAEAASEKGLPGKWVFTTDKPSMIPFLQYSSVRELRRKIFTAYTMRGNNNNDYDNKKTVSRILDLRVRKARLLGYETFADFVLETKMAKNPAGVYGLLDRLWKPALKVAGKEAAALQQIVDREGGSFRLAPWDWWFYAEKLRKEKYNLDDSELRPFFKLQNVVQGVFWVATRLYGLTFHPLAEIPRPHAEAVAYEVREADGSHLGVLYLDFFPRAGKQVGAWCGEYRERSRRTGTQIDPIVTIVCNFTRPGVNKPALLSLDEVETLFHEFGHALDGLFADNTYATTFVARDFVELPSQIMEHWATEPDVLKHYARHFETDKEMPAELIRKIQASSLFNQGFETVEFLAACLLDMEMHTLKEEKKLDVEKFEKTFFKDAGLIPEIVSRYRSTYFAHVTVWGYSAGYYSYIWSGVLDNDAFEAFSETSLFNKKTAELFRINVLEKNGIADPAELYRRFRGRDPKIDALLKNRGLN